MALRAGYTAMVWSVEKKEECSIVKITTMNKDKNGKYLIDFSGNVRFIGEAHRLASTLKERDRIKIGDFEVATSYNKQTKVIYTNYVLFSCELINRTKPADSKHVRQPHW